LQRETRELKTLLKISEAINYALNLAMLEMLLLELISEAVPAETGALLMLNGEDEVGDEFGSTFALDLKASEGKGARVSSAIARQI
jgi:hypothetical protein